MFNPATYALGFLALAVLTGLVFVVASQATIWAALGMVCLWLAVVVFLLDIFKGGGRSISWQPNYGRKY